MNDIKGQAIAIARMVKLLQMDERNINEIYEEVLNDLRSMEIEDRENE